MDFYIDSAEALDITDQEIAELLFTVYIEAGFAAPEMATSLFEPSAVRGRGKIIGAREKQTLTFAGMVIVVYPNSPACRLAQGNETEMHLLGVKPAYRGHGLGRTLVTAAIETVKQGGYSNMLLMTQSTMQAAHRLYESTGFVRIPARDLNRGGRDFMVYERSFK